MPQARNLVEVQPAGMVAFFCNSTTPAGWLKCNGAAVSRTTYADLFAAIGVTYGAGDGSTTFNVPDLRGEFLRGFDDGRGVDTGRAIGTAQGDAIRDITGSFNPGNQSGSTAASGAFSRSGGVSCWDGGQGFTGSRTVSFAASAVVPTAPENRPRNIAMLACIKF